MLDSCCINAAVPGDHFGVGTLFLVSTAPFTIIFAWTIKSLRIFMRWSNSEIQGTREDSVVRWRIMKPTRWLGGDPIGLKRQMEMHMVYEVGGTKTESTQSANDRGHQKAHEDLRDQTQQNSDKDPRSSTLPVCRNEGSKKQGQTGRKPDPLKNMVILWLQRRVIWIKIILILSFHLPFFRNLQ